MTISSWRNVLVLFTISVSFILTSCNEPILWNDIIHGDIMGEVWTGHNANKIRIACTKGCLMLSKTDPTLTLSHHQQYQIRQFLKQQSKHKPVLIAPCDHGLTPPLTDLPLTRLVFKTIQRLGYSATVVRPVVPYKKAPCTCVNLLRGHLKIIPPVCPNLQSADSVYHIGSDFGCSDARNFSLMIANPWDLIAQSGDTASPATRISRGNMNYNDGVHSTLKVETEDKVFGTSS